MMKIEGFEGYTIDREGRILSSHLRDYKKTQYDKYGYKVVTLSNKGRRKTVKLHRLLAIHFLPNLEGKPLVNHKNGVKVDNRLENLEWCTAQENVQHAYDTKLQEGAKGEVNTNSKLTEWDVLFIRYWHNKFKLSMIAEMFNVSKSLIEKVVYRQNWKHI